MLTHAQETLIASLHTVKGRREHGLCLVEGDKVIAMAQEHLSFTFTRGDTRRFDRLVTTTTPQDHAAVARIPQWTRAQILSTPTLIVLDGVQDPGNVGAILRLCLGFHAALILVNSADPSSPKVVRASVGALFAVPWCALSRDEAAQLVTQSGLASYRLEMRANASPATPQTIGTLPSRLAIIAGSEGRGITMDIDAPSLYIPHDLALESLNVGHALAIILALRDTALTA